MDAKRTNMSKVAIESFLERWEGATGSEQANSQLFLAELCQALGLEAPDPASRTAADNAYVFERHIKQIEPDGSTHLRRIDLYRRGCFVLESKKVQAGDHTKGHQAALRDAFFQAQGYVHALPADEGRPPFIVVVDVGRSIDLYAEFTRTGGNYVPYPDPGRHRIALADVRRPAVQERLRALWLDPDALDPSRHAAKVTREISAQLATLARSMEQDGYDVERVSLFLMRSLFTMFAEDAGLIPQGKYTALLERLEAQPQHFPDAMRSLWEAMNHGGYEGQVMARIPRFNGGLFRSIDPIPLSAEQIGLLLASARYDWTEVEPAIFGTLLERALDPRERHKLGAHYTPRAYVERLVLPTVIEPLREEWKNIQVAALADYEAGRAEPARKTLRAFHYRLCETRILDPACGSGNFLYVAMEHLKRLEGEVLQVLADLSEGQTGFDTEGLTVDPHQFLGLEINPRAVAIAEMVLWIGYLQWHYRLYRRLDNLPEPILRDFHNIEYRDALIEYDDRQPVTDEQGEPVTIWDGVSYKESPITGELIPDESGRINVYHYSNPRRAEWPKADYIVGNPPYLGARRIRSALGDGYLQALRGTYPDIPEHVDFVMYWWAKAAQEVGNRRSKRFGLITTNSLRQSFSRKVVEDALREYPKLSIKYVAPDHPWVDSVDGAAVRVTLITVAGSEGVGTVATVRHEVANEEGGYHLSFNLCSGKITPNLTIGVDPGSAKRLMSNIGVSSVGYQLTGKGFVLDNEQRKRHGEIWPDCVIKPLWSGRDITQSPRGLWTIDVCAWEIEEIKREAPSLYQWLLTRVKPERDQNNRSSLRRNWWVYGEARNTFRPALDSLERCIATSLTAKHRTFVFVEAASICDSTTAMIAIDRAEALGVLSSRAHVVWTLAIGGTLEDRPRYNKTRCFETFPFPDLDDRQAEVIGDLAERIDAHRKARQAEHADLTLTGMYNVLEKARADEILTAKERAIYEQGVVSILSELHDDLDRAVCEAYGWGDLAERLVGRPGATTPLPDKPADQAEAEEELLSRLVDLNTQRAAEEARGHVRWLRPDFQAPEAEQGEIKTGGGAQAAAAEVPAAAAGKLVFPKSMVERVQTVRDDLAEGPSTVEALADRYKRKPRQRIEETLQAVAIAGMAYKEGEVWRLR